MKKINKLLSVLLVVLMLTCSAPLQGFVGLELPEFGLTAQAATITSYNTGDIIEFGWYPQSEVTDADTIAALNAADGEWISYNYYSGTGNYKDGKMTASDFMRYKDVVYNGNKYRGVVFDAYRPFYTGLTASADSSNQTYNGYYINTIYWFKYEPIRWRVLDPQAGMVLSNIILDSQAYCNYRLVSGTDEYGNEASWGDVAKTYYANNYEKSSIRAWLNADFYNTAFSAAQQNIIVSTMLDNSAYSTSYSAYDSASTNDKIYLLSYGDAKNTNYGFSSSTSKSSSRRVQGSAYAKCQGLSSGENGNSSFMLRSAGYDSRDCCEVDYDGVIYRSCYAAYTCYGVRPVFNFDLSSEIFQSDIVDFGDESTENECEHLNIETLAEKVPTCTTTGLTEGKKCSDCDEILVEQVEIPALDHTFTNWKTDYKVGDIVQFGSYPQSELKDEGLIAELNARAPEWDNWVSYGYYSGNNSDGSMVQGDWMRYTDVTYNGEKYRGVKFTQYRPYSTTSSSSKTKSYQDENGYNLNTSYWFRFEPIKWRVLDVNTGFVVSEYLLDTQAYNNTVYYNSNSTESKYAYFNDSSYTNYASDYATSSIRTWLNDYFYCTAFTAAQGNQIKTTSIDNNGYFTSQGTAGYERLDGEATEDKIFLLSSNDVKNRKYGFSSSEQSSSTTREALGSDYAKIQGLYKINGYNSSFWFLRTPGYNSKSCCLVNELGYFYGNYNGVTNLDSGVRPSLCLNDLGVTDSRYVLPSCSANGSITYTCECGEVKVETIDALEHTFSDWEIIKDSATGKACKQRICSVCEFAEIKELKAYTVGDVIEIGSYPQTQVTDASLLSALNALTLQWVSYGYYTGGSSSNYMKYADVEYEGEKYRAVTFSRYRPTWSSWSSSSGYQQENGYYSGETYWFRYEPIKWFVVDPAQGLLISSLVLDSQEWHNASTTNNYYNSSIRKWLNDTFYNTAFTNEAVANLIQLSELDNSSPYAGHGSVTSYDKVFIPSLNEMQADISGFWQYTDRVYANLPKATDYSKAQGLSVNLKYDGIVSWWLRTASDNDWGYAVDQLGGFGSRSCINDTYLGVRPAMRIDMSAFDCCEHPQSEIIPAIAVTCTDNGCTQGKKCTVCSGILVLPVTIPAIGHTLTDWTITQQPTLVAEGKQQRTCTMCEFVESEAIARLEIDYSQDENYGIANFTVLNSSTKAPLKNASIFVSTDAEGESTFYTDAEGKVSIVLPVGANIITAHAKGLISRTLTVDIVHGENDIPAIGLGSSPIVEAELVTTPMTKEEIIDAGIDVTAPGNNNVIKYEVTFEFKAQEPASGGGEPPKTTITETFYVNSNGDHYYQNNNQSNTYEIFGEPVTIHPTERFYLIITGDIIWLKEMFHVQLYAYNNSNTDWIEDVVATLQLPEGLSLADMVDGEQTLAQQMGTIAEGGQADCEWYVRGDKEGIYDLTATLTGRIMPFGEDFSNEYTAEEAIRVYSGKGLSISFEVPTTTYCGDEYPVKIILENISDKPIYNVAHVLTGISQTKVTHYANGEVVEEIYVKDSLDKAAFVDEFNPGDQLVLELTANILFESEVYKDCIFELVDIIFNAKELGEAINNNFGFPTEHDWGEWETVQESTCGEAGLEKRVCKNNADHVETKEIEKLPHDWDDGVIEPVSTCKDYGVKTYTCKNDASHTKTEVVPLDPDNHIVDTYIKDAADNTCEEDGYTGNIHCAGCHVKLSDGEVIPAHGHDYQKIDAKCKAPDYGVTGYDYYECSYDASHNYTVEVAPLVKTTFTATFVTTAPFFKEDKIVAEVTFVQGDKFVEEPAVDKYDNYTFAWDEYELKDEDIVIYGRYTEIEINDITTPETEKKAEINNGVATITLEAKANSKNIKILSEKTKPVDVILVLDQSGSMAETLSSNGKTKREALIECANDFVKELYDNAVATGAEHRVAVVGFSYSDYNGGNYKNTGILATANGKSINYKSLKDADYASALMSVATVDGINANITKGINSVVADGATSAHLGLEMANNIFAMTEKQAGRERIVLFITDGTPTSWGEETDLVKTTAAKAITEANELKNAQGAKIYSIGVHANAEPTANFTSDDYGVATDNRGNFKSYDFNRFLHAVSSNYPTAGSIRVSEMGDGSKNAGYYLGVQDTSKLSEIFSKILLSSVYEVRTFDKVTIVDTVSKEFTLALEQETEMRERLIADLGIRNEDITVTRNADGTTTLRFDNVRTQKIYNEDGSSNYSAKISFDVSADEDSLGLTEVKTNTTNAGVEFDGETIEKFEIPTVVLEPDRKLIVFTVNGVVYRIEEAKLGDGIVAPESTLAEWNIPEGTVVDSDYVVFEANAVESSEYTVTWVSENSKITQTYSFGDAIAIPAAAEKAEYEFLKWSPDVPATMPNYSITFTAVYTPKHSHVYNKAYTFGKCTEGITTVYECACGDSYEETAPVTEHSAKAVVEQTNNGTLIEKVTCQICGTTNSQELTYKVTYKDGWRNTVLDLTLLDNDISVQPDGTLEIRFYVGEKINKNYTVYRIDENGKKTSYTPRKQNGYLIFDADHFSFYVVAELDEETGEIIDDATYEEVYCVSNGHDYAAVTTAPTCTEDGFTTYTCSVCGDFYVDDVITASGHTEETVPGKAATCTQTGLSDGTKCSVCGTVLTEQIETAKLAHKDENKDYKCDYGCGHEFDRPATPDQPSDNTCDHLCHKDGFVGFIWKIVRFFQKLFGMNPVCSCGKAHY